MKLEIILFDMDGILLLADGYHQALESSLKMIGQNIGIEVPGLHRDHILHFEAAGVTHEWETLAICAAILLIQVWEIDGNVRIPERLDPEPVDFLLLGEDRFMKFVEDIDLQGIPPTTYAKTVLLENHPSLNSDQKQYLDEVLGSGIDTDRSPTLRFFQEFVLGSDLFSQTYPYPPSFDTKSYLALYDRNALTEQNRLRLLDWLKADHCRAAIFTNRPSQPPDGFFSTPEAELGAAAVGLETIPILGAGVLSWFANAESRPLDYYYKPSPVHVLAALQLAVGRTMDDALEFAADLFHGKLDPGPWIQFQGARVVVLEDLVPGIKSARAARELLTSINIDLDLTCVGITTHTSKAKVLSRYADLVIDDINQGILPNIILNQEK